MALYDFVCRECGHVFEVFARGFIREEQKECPKCGSGDVRQKFSSFLRNGSSASGCGAPVGSPFG